MRDMVASVGLREEIAVRINCDKNGCEEHHSDHGRVVWIFDPRNEAKQIESLLLGESYRINGHATDVVSRVVVLPQWQVLEVT